MKKRLAVAAVKYVAGWRLQVVDTVMFPSISCVRHNAAQ